MAQYFYVNSGGLLAASADTPYTSQQTGTFPSAANCYASVNAALSSAKTTDPDHGDYVLIADTYDDNYTITTDIVGKSQSRGAGVALISVDANNCEKYKRGATVSTTGGSASLQLYGTLLVAGIDFEPDDNFSALGEENITLYDCSTTASGSGDVVFGCTSMDGHLRAIKTTFNFNDAGVAGLRFGNGIFHFINCDFQTTASYTNGCVIKSFDTNHWHVHFIGCDFSGVAFDYIIDYNEALPSPYANAVYIKNCEKHTSSDWVQSTSLGHGGNIRHITNSGDSTGGSEYQYYYETAEGKVEEDTGIYRDGSAPWLVSGQQVSYKVTTASTGDGNPFFFELPSLRYTKLSSTATDTLRLHITTAVTLTDGDIWAEAIYPDGTVLYQTNTITTPEAEAYVPASFRNIAASTLSTNTESWTGALSNRYHIDINTSQDPGSDSAPMIRVWVSKPSTTLYICSTIETY
jgi:hypothetical protein